MNIAYERRGGCSCESIIVHNESVRYEGEKCERAKADGMKGSNALNLVCLTIILSFSPQRWSRLVCLNIDIGAVQVDAGWYTQPIRRQETPRTCIRLKYTLRHLFLRVHSALVPTCKGRFALCVGRNTYCKNKKKTKKTTIPKRITRNWTMKNEASVMSTLPISYS